MSRELVFVTASPSSTSRSTFVARRIAADAERRGVAPVFFSVQDFDATELLQGRATAPWAVRFLEHVARAEGIVLATPVYKASYTGGLKAVVDILSPDALVGKRALGIATTKLAPHGADAAAAFRALFAFFKTAAPETLVLLDSEITIDGGSAAGGALSADAEARVVRAGERIASAGGS